jgi:hypothetical protein
MQLKICCGWQWREPGLKACRGVPIPFEQGQRAERRIGLTTFPIREGDAIVLERDSANRKSKPCGFSASAMKVEVSEFQHVGMSLALPK